MDRQILTIRVTGADGTVKAETAGEGRADLVYDAEYAEGDRIVFTGLPAKGFTAVQPDDAMLPAIWYTAGTTAQIIIPFGDDRLAISPRAFTGSRHLISARIPEKEEISGRRLLSANSVDGFTSEGVYPHAHANVETRNEAVFMARNAIDGLYANHSHGQYPWSSWGINRDPNAEWTLEFGRPVRVEELAVTLRADFPHDSWFTRAEAAFSDGTSETLRFEKSDRPQRFTVAPRTVEWVKFGRLVKADDPSPFPALTQFDVYGTEAE